jgi:hypothetical protein
LKAYENRRKDKTFSSVHGENHRINMELDLQSLFGLLWTAVLIG